MPRIRQRHRHAALAPRHRRLGIRTGFALIWLLAGTGSHLSLFAPGLAAALTGLLVAP